VPLGPPPGGIGVTFVFAVGTQAVIAGTLMVQPGSETKPPKSAV
jgi:hypothetical protein